MSAIRADFPILARQFREQNLVYLDSAATTQKPAAVIDAVDHYYRHYNANVHRAAHVLAAEATDAMEQARRQLQHMINARSHAEIIFTRGTTEAINLVANCIDSALPQPLGPADTILISELEHHSNIVPWQMLAQRTGARIAAVAVTPSGDLDLQDFQHKLSQAKIVSLGHVSNALGTINPIADMLADARAAGAVTVIDGAQAALHQDIDVQALDCDFYAFSGHKMYGPTGIGVLYGKLDLLERMQPWQGGGEMIDTVTIESSTYQQPPFKFEAGTPNIAGIIGLGAAVTYLSALDKAQQVAAEDELIRQTISGLQQIPGVRLVGEPQQRSAVVSFVVDSGHCHDIGMLLDQQGVAVRTGHHCTMPLMQKLAISGTVRASFSFYNNSDDVQRLLAGVDKAITFL